MKKIIPIVLILLAATHSRAQITIAAARSMGEGTTVTVRGIVTNGPELGTIRYFQDGTGGIAAYSSIMSGVQRGDSVEVTGVIDFYNNLIEINPVNSFTVISSGNALPAPVEVDMATGFDEPYESQLVRFNQSWFLSTGTFATNDANYDVTDGSLVSAELRCDGSTDIAGTPIPVGALDLVGIMSQYQSTYQLLPRDLNDFISSGNPPVFTSSLFQYNIATDSFDISFSTQNPGNTIIYYGTTTSLGSVATDAFMTTGHVISLTGLAPATLYYVKAASVSSVGDTSFTAITPMFTRSLSTQTIHCYFTRTVDNTFAQGTNAVSLPQIADDTLIAYMNRAKYTMDIAIYNMDNDNGIVDAINAAYNRGVTVRLIGDGENMDATAYGQLLIGSNNKKLSPTSSNYGIMHNKFVAIDADSPDPNDAVLWTGSMNFTDEQVNSDANNMIIFQDQSLARAYEIEFNEMWSGLFGPDKTNNTPKEFNIGGNRVELYFSPSDDTEGEIIRTAGTADHDLQFCIYAFTRISIAYAIDDRTSMGVWGGGVIDDTSSLGYGFDVLSQHMPGTLFVANHSYLIHNKYLLVDANAPGLDPLVLTGSHNWSSAAQTKNDENTVVVHNASIANQYYQEWMARYHDEGGTAFPPYIVSVNDPHTTPLQLFPNPADDGVQLVFQSGESASVTVSDLSGKTVLQQSSDHNTSLNLNVKNLEEGIYFIRVLQGAAVYCGKLLVQH